MNNLLTDINNLLIFIIEFLVIYLPCMVGALLGRRFNQLKGRNTLKNTSSKKKNTIRYAIAISLTSSIIPALVILISDFLLPDDRKMSYMFKYGLAMMLGFVGADKITECLMNLSNLLRVMRAISNGAQGLSQISEIVDKIDDPDDPESNDKENK